MSEQKQLIKADTVYGLIQSVNDILRDRFTSKGRTLDDNSWRTCNAHSLEVGFWKAIRDRDFGSVLTYAAMLAGRGVNVADIVHGAIDKYDAQFERAEAKLITANDTIRLQRITIEQHEKTIADLRAKLDEKGTPEPYLFGGVALESERIPELCYSVEAVCDNTVETLVIQGDPAAVKDLVLAVRAEKTTCDGPRSDVNIVLDSSKTKEDPIIAGTVAAAVVNMHGKMAALTRDIAMIEATNLIMQLPAKHEGRATWLQNHATHYKSAVQREMRKQPTAFYSAAHAEEWVRNTYGPTLSPDE